MRLTNSIVAFAVAARLPVVALAGARGPGVNHRQASRQARIPQGANSGELTRGEAHRLAAEPRPVWQEDRAYESDGKLTQDERKDLFGALRGSRVAAFTKRSTTRNGAIDARAGALALIA
jgi:hypothetical protein